MTRVYLTPTRLSAAAAGQRLTLALAEFCRRVSDLLFVFGVGLLTAPLMLLMVLIGRVPLRRVRRCGLAGQPFVQYALGNGRLSQLPVLWNLLRGEMTLVGPRAVAEGDPLAYGMLAEARWSVRPGLVGLHWLRQRANIDYGSELDDDLQYIANRSLRGDWGILLRCVPALLYGRAERATSGRMQLLGLPIDNLTMDEAIGQIVDRMQADVPSQVVFVNADCVNLAARNLAYRGALRQADLVLADGIGMKLAGKILRRPIRQNVNGTDLFPRLCSMLTARDQGVFLLGGRPGIADAVADWVRQEYPHVELCGTQHGYFTAAEEAAVVERIRASGAKLLLVAFGAPRQDLWIETHLAECGVRVAMGVGGLFDFFSGRIPRAPHWVRELGLEWFYRFTREPGRLWRRYFVGNVVFMGRVFLARLFRQRYTH